MDYGQILSRAGQITWRYKFLWIFGIIMALCGQAGGSQPNFNFSTSAPGDFGGVEGGLPDFPAFFPEPFGQTPLSVYIIAGLCLFTFFAILGIIAGAFGRGALIKTVDRVETGEPVGLNQSFQDGLARILPLGFLQFLVSLPLFIFFMIGLAAFFIALWPIFDAVMAGQTPPAFIEDMAIRRIPIFIVAACGMACVAILVQLAIALFVTFGSRAIVLENYNILESFGRSWSLFRQNLGPTIILTIVTIVLHFAVGLVMAVPALVIMVPIMIGIMPQMFSEMGPSFTDFFIIGAAAIFIWILFSLVMGVLQVYLESLWTLAYQSFTNPAAPELSSD